MMKLEDVKIYSNHKNEYQLTYCEKTGYINLVQHENVNGYGFIYGFYSKEFLESLFCSPRLDTYENTWYSSYKEEADGSMIVLIINKDSEGGICVYDDWRPQDLADLTYKTT